MKPKQAIIFIKQQIDIAIQKGAYSNCEQVYALIQALKVIEQLVNEKPVDEE